MSTMPNRILRPSQKENLQRPKQGLTSRSQVPRRAALGNISNQVRVQPSRAVKGSHEIRTGQDENACTQQKIFGKAKQQPFTIFVDEPSQPSALSENAMSAAAFDLEDIENRLPSIDDVAPLPELHSAVHDEQPKLGASPMLLDTSVTDTIDDEIDTIEAVEDTQGRIVDRAAYIQDVPEYADDIYDYMLSTENKLKPRPGFMRRQVDVTSTMRAILVDWLVEVAEEYKLHRETLFLAVNYIDRFLSVMSVARPKLQLVGTAAMFLAAKYEEIYPPDVSEFVYITDDTYTKKQVLRMEHLLLKVLQFDVSIPTVSWFCDRILRDTGADDQTQYLTMYLTELVLVEMDTFLKYPSSLVAAAALCLANITLDLENPWPDSHQRSSHYSLQDLAPCLREMHILHRQAEDHPQQSVREKYKLTKFMQVAFMPSPAALSVVGV